MRFRIAPAVCAALAVAAAAPAFAAAPAASDRQALRDALMAAPSARPTVADPARDRFARPEPTPAASPGTRETDERSRPDIEALGPRPAMHAGFRLKF